MSFEGGNLSETDLLQYICNFCKCYLNIAPVRIVDGKLACGRCDGDGMDVPFVETIMKLMTLPCRFKASGCRQLVKWNDVQHDLVCVYNIRECVVSNCFLKAAYRGLPAHIVENHSEKVIIPRQKIKVEPSVVSSYNFVYIDGNRIFPVSFSIDKSGLNYYVAALCGKPQLQCYTYDLTIHQNDVVIAWCSKKLVMFGDEIVNKNNIPFSHLQCFFDKSKNVEVSICVYIDNIAPPSNEFYAIMDNFKCRSCSRKFFPYKRIHFKRNVLSCSRCNVDTSLIMLMVNIQFEDHQIQRLLSDLDCRPLSLHNALWNIKCTICKGIMSNELSVRNGQWFCSKKCDDKCSQMQSAQLNTDCVTFFKNLLSLMN